MQTKLDILKGLLAEGDEVGALRIASRFQELGEWKEDITRGWAAHTCPQLYKDMGHDPTELFQLGIRAIKQRYNIQ